MKIPFKVYYNDNNFQNETGDGDDLELLSTGNVIGHPEEPVKALEIIFAFFNGVDKAEDTIELTSPLYDLPRSMSVGDVVVLGETGWRCQNVGWCKMDPDYLPRESMAS